MGVIPREVWSWDGSWLRGEFTGTEGPNGQRFAGQHHYLHFVSDSSVTSRGFSLSAVFHY